MPQPVCLAYRQGTQTNSAGGLPDHLGTDDHGQYTGIMELPIVEPEAADLLEPYPDHLRQRLQEIATGLAIENATNTGSQQPMVTVRDVRRAESLIVAAVPAPLSDISDLI